LSAELDRVSRRRGPREGEDAVHNAAVITICTEDDEEGLLSPPPRRLDFSSSHASAARSPPPQEPPTSGGATDIIVYNEITNIGLKQSDLDRLNPEIWLCDNVITFYLNGMLQERELREQELAKAQAPRSHFFNTFFYKHLTTGHVGYDFEKGATYVKPRNIGYSILNCRKLFFPLHENGVHWVLAEADMQLKTVQIFDCLYGGTPAQTSRAKVYCTTLCQFVVDYMTKEEVPHEEEVRRAVATAEKNRWTFIFHDRNTTPRQLNDFDCGVFMLMCAKYRSRGSSLDFDQADMPSMREELRHEILQNQLTAKFDGVYEQSAGKQQVWW
jgi:sentrin-specific protease 1